jgi:hypothetical protein
MLFLYLNGDIFAFFNSTWDEAGISRSWNSGQVIPSYNDALSFLIQFARISLYKKFLILRDPQHLASSLQSLSR